MAAEPGNRRHHGGQQGVPRAACSSRPVPHARPAPRLARGAGPPGRRLTTDPPPAAACR